MCKGTWVCFLCRVAVRRDTWRLVTHVHPELVGDTMSGRVKCPECRSVCRFLGPSITIPPKRDARGWSQLENQINRFQRDHAEQSKKVKTQTRHAIERRIGALEKRGESTGRIVLIKELKKELKPNKSITAQRASRVADC